MANLHRSNPYNRSGYRPLPQTFDTDFIKHIDNGLCECGFNPREWFEQLHREYDLEIGKDEVSRHIIKAITDSEFEGTYNQHQ